MIKNSENKLNYNKIITIFILVISFISILGFKFYNTNQQMKDDLNVDTIYNNIYINGVDVGGLTKEEAEQKLNETIGAELSNKAITITNEEQYFTIYYSDLNSRYDYTAAIDEAYSYARTGKIRERYDIILGLEEEPLMIETTFPFSYDEENIYSFLEAHKYEVDIKPTNPTATSFDHNGSFVYTEGTSGKSLDVEKTGNDIKNLVDNQEEGTVEASFYVVEPEYNVDSFSQSTDLIGTGSTNYTSGQSPRNTNIQNASSKIDGKIVYPGEVFSTNEALGEMTEQNGYAYATVIVSGQLTDDIGGGVCQVSSTLYNAVMYAELEVVERQNHSMKVGYEDYGFDATLAGDYIDFKFKNNTDYPIIIESYLTEDKVVVNIYGNETRPSNREVHYENLLVETIEPEPTIYTDTDKLPKGQTEVKTKPRTGYRYEVYKVVTIDGKEVERTLYNKSYYKPIRGETLVGTGS